EAAFARPVILHPHSAGRAIILALSPPESNGSRDRPANPRTGRCGTRRGQTYRPGGGVAAGAGRSELKMSAITFHRPSACFFQTTTYLPRSVTGLPAAPCAVS